MPLRDSRFRPPHSIPGIGRPPRCPLRRLAADAWAAGARSLLRWKPRVPWVAEQQRGPEQSKPAPSQPASYSAVAISTPAWPDPRQSCGYSNAGGPTTLPRARFAGWAWGLERVVPRPFAPNFIFGSPRDNQVQFGAHTRTDAARTRMEMHHRTHPPTACDRTCLALRIPAPFVCRCRRPDGAC